MIWLIITANSRFRWSDLTIALFPHPSKTKNSSTQQIRCPVKTVRKEQDLFIFNGIQITNAVQKKIIRAAAAAEVLRKHAKAETICIVPAAAAIANPAINLPAAAALIWVVSATRDWSFSDRSVSPLHTEAPRISAITSPEEISKTGGLSHHQTPHLKTGMLLSVIPLILTERLDLQKAVINRLTGR